MLYWIKYPKLVELKMNKLKFGVKKMKYIHSF